MSRKKKVLLIGWDGADWEHITPLLDEGLLPTLDQLINEGTMGNLATLQPVLSPMLWNSVCTGKFADKHGILGFVEPDPQTGGARPYSSLSRKSKAIWNIFSQNDLRSNVVNWWASHPAEPINGTIVSNLFNGVTFDESNGWKITPGTIHPKEKEQEYAQFKFLLSDITPEQLLPFIPKADKVDQEKDKRLQGFVKTYAEMMTTHSVATAVMEREPWDFMAIYYTGIDHFSHGFMQFHPPKLDQISEEQFEIYKDVVKGAYRFHDMMLERLLQLAGDDTTVILCSDHGFQSGSFRPMGTPREPAGPASWHRRYGMLVMKGEGIKKDERIYGASLIDIGPTLLHLFDLPIGEDMDGRPLLEAFEEPQDARTIPSWEEVDGNHGCHGPDAAMSENNANSEELLKQFVALGYIEDLDDDKEKQGESADIEGKYNLARCLMWQQREDDALPLLEEILKRSPWESRFILQLADCYFRAGYLQQCRQMLESAFDLSKTAVQVVILYANCLLAFGESDAGLKLLRKAIRQAPGYPGLYVRIGELFSKQRKWDEAEQAFRKALEFHPENPKAYHGLADVCLRLQRYPEAEEAALTALGLIHRMPKTHLVLGIALIRSGDADRALVALKQAEKFAPRMPRVHRWMAIAYDALNNTTQADICRLKYKTMIQARSIDKQQASERSGQLFELPDMGTDQSRMERLLKERPSPTDEVEKSGKTFCVVSGLPRSGTSLMMQMLVAGGIDAISDGVREADIDNPKGYFEWEAIKRIGKQPELLDPDEYEGKVFKAVSVLLKELPREHDYKVIFMVRPIDEVVQSQKKMIERLGTDGSEVTDEDLLKRLLNHRNKTVNWMNEAEHVEFLAINYPKLVESPQSFVQEIVEFLGDDLVKDPVAMASVVDSSLYRARR